MSKEMERVRESVVEGAKGFDEPVVVLADIGELTGVFMLMLGRNAIMCEREDATMLKLRDEDNIKRILSISDMLAYLDAIDYLEVDGEYENDDYQRISEAFEADPWGMLYTVLGMWS